MKQKRLDYIDRAKGVAILLMVLGHAAPGKIIHTWIFAFHMPLFFIVSGVLMREKYLGTISFLEVGNSFKKRLFQLGVPYVVFSLLLTLFFGSLNYFSSGHWNISKFIFQFSTLQGVGPLWFIPSYFVAEFLMRLSCICPPKLVNVIGVSSIILVIVLFSLSDTISSFWLIRLGVRFLICYSFIYVGYALSLLNLLKHLKMAIAILLFGVCSIMALYNGFSEIASIRLNNPILFYVNAIGITWTLFFFLNISKDTKVMKSLSFFGRNSIVILCTNNIIIEIIRLLDYRIWNNILLSWNTCGAIVLTVIIIIIEVGLIKIINMTPAKFLFGKR